MIPKLFGFLIHQFYQLCFFLFNTIYFFPSFYNNSGIVFTVQEFT